MVPPIMIAESPRAEETPKTEVAIVHSHREAAIEMDVRTTDAADEGLGPKIRWIRASNF